MLVLKLLKLFAYITITNCQNSDDLIVQTRNGLVRGIEHLSVKDKKPFYSFRGIPFAEPPIGPLRFEPPVPKSNWSGVYNATRDGSSCVQNSNPPSGSEDCLFINVYTPIRPSDSCTLLPTMAWIYGGAFILGGSTYSNYAPDFFLEKDVVVVTFNYRLGFLGYFTTGDLVAPGNSAMKDQVLALKWIQENIANFCGNPKDVTLAGQSAGSASVAYHVHSPKSAGLFHKAILQSGVSLSLWATERHIPKITRRVAETLGINATSSQSILNGLKGIDLETLQNTASSAATSELFASNPRDGLALGPVVEPDHPDAFFTGGSYELLQSGNFNRVPIMLGFTSLEAKYSVEFLLRMFVAQYDYNSELLLPVGSNIDTDKRLAAARKIKNRYFGYKPISLSDREVMAYISDDMFVRPVREFARLVSQYAPVYLYRFSYEGGVHNRTISGVGHAEELGFLWVFWRDSARDHDYIIRSRLVHLWTNFIKHGNPTPKREAMLQNIIWGSLGSQLNYLEIGEHLVFGQEPEKDNMQFWDDFYAEYGNPPYGTSY